MHSVLPPKTGCDTESSAISGEGYGMPRAKAWAQDNTRLAGHQAGVANQRGRAPVNADLLRQGKIRATRARERVPHLGAVLGEAWQSV
jgi:hypothetical protein